MGVLVRLALDLICHLWEVLEVADLASGAGFVLQESHLRLKLKFSNSPPVILGHGGLSLYACEEIGNDNDTHRLGMDHHSSPL